MDEGHHRRQRRPLLSHPGVAAAAALAAAIVVLPATVLAAAPGGGGGSPTTVAPSPRPATDLGPPVATLTVSGSTAQRIVAFGASGAWWPNALSQFPASAQQQVGDLLFGPTGIGLTGYRYNIGGGGVGVRRPMHVAPTMLVRPGVYDWGADPAGMRFLELAASHQVPVLTGFVNSAPAVWKTDGLSCGGGLIPGTEPAYASYLAEVVRHLREANGIKLSYVSPMNEPDASFARCAQEGMAVPPLQRAAIVDALGPALARQAPWARVIADESSQVYNQLLPESALWLSAPGVTHWLAAIAHHTYDYPTDAQLASVASLGPRYGLPTWTTEICCFDGQDFGGSYDPTIKSGMWLANSIWQDLAITGDSSFNWWVAVSGKLGCDPDVRPTCPYEPNPSGRNDGLLYFDPAFKTEHDYTITTTKRFWVLGNFSRFIRPGAVRHPVLSPPDLRTVAFANRGGGWCVVVVDDSVAPGVPVTVRLVLPPGRNLSPVGGYRTSASEDLAPVPLPVASSASSYLLRVSPQSVTTYVFDPASLGSRHGSGSAYVLASSHGGSRHGLRSHLRPAAPTRGGR